MRPCEASRIRDQFLRAEAWKRKALAYDEERRSLGFALADAQYEAQAVDLGPCPRCEDMQREVVELEREARYAAREAYVDGRNDERYDREEW